MGFGKGKCPAQGAEGGIGGRNRTAATNSMHGGEEKLVFYLLSSPTAQGLSSAAQSDSNQRDPF